MERKMVIAFPPLTDEQREKIAAKAAKKGFRAVFCKDSDEALSEAKDAEIVMSLDKRLAKAGPDLKWYCTPSAGVDHVLPELEGTDILLSNSSGAYGVTIAEHIVMIHNILYTYGTNRQQKWPLRRHLFRHEFQQWRFFRLRGRQV